MKIIKSLMPDLLILSGAASVSYGAYLMYEPFGYVAAGAICLVIGVFFAISAE